MAHESLYYIGVKAVIRNARGKYLVLQITRRSDNYIYWDLPGGRIAEGESTADTLEREVAEETGIADLKIEKPVIMALSGVKLPHHGGHAGIVFDVYLCTTTQETLKLEENMTARWCTRTELVEALTANRDYPQSIINAVGGL